MVPLLAVIAASIGGIGAQCEPPHPCSSTFGGALHLHLHRSRLSDPPFLHPSNLILSIAPLSAVWQRHNSLYCDSYTYQGNTHTSFRDVDAALQACADDPGCAGMAQWQCDNAANEFNFCGVDGFGLGDYSGTSDYCTYEKPTGMSTSPPLPTTSPTASPTPPPPTTTQPKFWCLSTIRRSNAIPGTCACGVAVNV